MLIIVIHNEGVELFFFLTYFRNGGFFYLFRLSLIFDFFTENGAICLIRIVFLRNWSINYVSSVFLILLAFAIFLFSLQFLQRMRKR